MLPKCAATGSWASQRPTEQSGCWRDISSSDQSHWTPTVRVNIAVFQRTEKNISRVCPVAFGSTEISLNGRTYLTENIPKRHLFKNSAIELACFPGGKSSLCPEGIGPLMSPGPQEGQHVYLEHQQGDPKRKGMLPEAAGPGWSGPMGFSQTYMIRGRKFSGPLTTTPEGFWANTHSSDYPQTCAF